MDYMEKLDNMLESFKEKQYNAGTELNVDIHGANYTAQAVRQINKNIAELKRKGIITKGKAYFEHDEENIDFIDIKLTADKLNIPETKKQLIKGTKAQLKDTYIER